MDFPRVRLSEWPTPFHRLDNISRILGAEVFAKREDLGLVGLGGNKLRKLEYILARALANRSDTVITTGAIQSNHCRLTAALAARCGLACHLVLRGKVPNDVTGNLLLNHLFGATVTFVESNDYAEADMAMESVADSVRGNGGSPFIIPLGGSHVESMVAFIDCAREIADQSSSLGHRPDAIVLATGTASTLIGLWLGAAEVLPETKVVGVLVSGTAEIAERRMSSLCDLARMHLGRTVRGRPVVLAEYRGPAYGVSDERTQQALLMMARNEGIMLDSTYSAKAFAGLLAEREQGVLADAKHIVFVHTGGVPELFARPPHSLGLRLGD